MLEALPHLGLYDQNGYLIFKSHKVQSDNLTFPDPMLAQISRLKEQSIDLSFSNLMHKCSLLEDSFEHFAEINIIFHSYVFFDSQNGEEHSCDVFAAVYTSENNLIRCNLNNYLNDGIAVNPSDIYKCKLFMCIHPNGNMMCISPNNARLKVSLHLPAYVFYTLVLVPYQGKIVKALATKHKMVINEQRLSELSWVKAIEHPEYNFEALMNLLERLGEQPGWGWYPHYLVWKQAGCPDVSKYGEHAWLEAISKHFHEGDPASEVIISQVFKAYVLDLAEWLDECSIKEID